MDSAQTQRLDRPVSRFAMLAGLGALGVFLWMLTSLLLGGSAAHADTTSPGGHGLLGGVTDAVSTVTSPVTKTVSKAADALTSTVTDATGAVSHAASDTVRQTTSSAASTASQTVQQTTSTVTHAPVVGAMAAPVVKTAQKAIETVDASVVKPVVTPVAALAESGVVKRLVDPVVSVVDSLPVVGGLVHATGLDGTLTGVAGALDSGVGTIVGTAADAVTGTVLPALDGGAPASGGPWLPPASGAEGGIPGLITPAEASSGVDAANRGMGLLAASADPTLLRAFAAAAEVEGALGAWTSPASAPAMPGSPFAVVLAQCALGGLCSFGSSGAAAGAAGALSALAFVVAYRAWMRRRDLDDRVPHAPVYATDTSPD